ncbi:hypothetical protein F5879DRAFT_780903, partial [Lentinula edodes]
MEFFSQFDCKIVYVAGELNTVADALSRRSDLDITLTPFERAKDALRGSRHPYAYCADSEAEDELPILCVLPNSTWSGASALAQAPPPLDVIATTLTITADASLLEEIRAGYKDDAWCKDLPSMSSSLPLVRFDKETKLWFIGDRLIIPRVGSI